MTEVKHWHSTTTRNPHSLASGRFYSMQSILQSAHVVPAGYSHSDLFYINNYVDWDQYNTLYLPDFLGGEF